MKYSSQQARSYWQSIHKTVRDDFSAVCYPESGKLRNRFNDYAHRLGMRWALGHLGPMNGKSILDVGAGRGRWTRFFAARGGKVTALDVSIDALLPHGNPAWHRIVGAADMLPLKTQTFDVVSAVTVLQHIPEHQHDAAFAEIGSALKPGGRFILLEWVGAYDEPHMMSRSISAWLHIAGSNGFRLERKRWSNYDVGLRAYYQVVYRLGRRVQVPDPIRQWRYISSAPRKLERLGEEIASLISWPIETACFYMQPPRGTHMVYIFRKQETPFAREDPEALEALQ